MGRRLRSLLPPTINHLIPETPSHQETQERFRKKQAEQKAYNDKAAISLLPLKMGEQVRLRKDAILKPTKVIEVFITPRSYFVETRDGAVYRWNHVNLNTERSAPAQKLSAEAHPRSSEQDTPEA